MTQEQYADLQNYIPESDMVKMTFEDIIGHSVEDWEGQVHKMVTESLSGDKEALFNLLELVYLNAYNEGELAEASAAKGK